MGVCSYQFASTVNRALNNRSAASMGEVGVGEPGRIVQDKIHGHKLSSLRADVIQFWACRLSVVSSV